MPKQTRFISILAIMLLLGCTKAKLDDPSTGAEEGKAPTPKAQKQELVVYSGRSAKLVDPLFWRFEEKTGIKVKVRSGKSDALANRIAMEGEKSEADLIFLQESGYLEVLGKKGLLASLSETQLEAVPREYRGSDNFWVGVSGRARVLVYASDSLKPEDLPRSLEALADPKWKGQVGWAPTNASFEAHVSALRHLWGEEKTKTWLSNMQGIEPKKYPKNSPQVRAVANGEIKIGWVNHYYLLRQKAAEPNLKAANFSFPTDQDPGNIMMLSGVAIVKTSKKRKAADALIQFLLSEDAQNHLTQKNFEYPAVKGIKIGPELEGLASKLSLVSQDKLTDIAGTQSLLQSLGLR